MILGLQELQDLQGWIVLAYTDPKELAADDARGVTDGNTRGSMNGIEAAIIGSATAGEWAAQEQLSGDYSNPSDYIAFRKVRVE